MAPTDTAMDTSSESLKRKEPTPDTTEAAPAEKMESARDVMAEASPAAEKTAAVPAAEQKEAAPASEKKETVAAPTSQPPAKKARVAADLAAVRKQVEYYLSDDNLRYDKFFHEKISQDSEGWLSMKLICSCKKMEVLQATNEDVTNALKESKVEVREDGQAVRRPGNAALPKLEQRPHLHQKKSVANAHAGGPIVLCKNVPAEQSWQKVKEAVKAKLPEKVAIWHVSEVTDKGSCVVVTAPFDGALKFFESVDVELGGAKLKLEPAQNEALQSALKALPKNIKEKREKEARKRMKEKNRPILLGTQKFTNTAALRGRVREILNSRSDGEVLKADGSDFKLLRALLDFHPKGAEKSKDLVSIKVGKSSYGDSRCFFMVKSSGEEEDFSAKKCLDSVDANPPFISVEPKEKKEDKKTEDKKEAAPQAEATAEAPKADEAKAEAPKAEADAAAPKANAKAEAAEAEAKAEVPTAEAKAEVPTAEAKAEAPKAEVKAEAVQSAANAEVPTAESKEETPSAEAKEEKAA